VAWGFGRIDISCAGRTLAEAKAVAPARMLRRKLRRLLMEFPFEAKAEIRIGAKCYRARAKWIAEFRRIASCQSFRDGGVRRRLQNFAAIGLAGVAKKSPRGMLRDRYLENSLGLRNLRRLAG
jgi:hypothetical protein